MNIYLRATINIIGLALISSYILVFFAINKYALNVISINAIVKPCMVIAFLNFIHKKRAVY